MEHMVEAPTWEDDRLKLVISNNTGLITDMQVQANLANIYHGVATTISISKRKRGKFQQQKDVSEKMI